MDPATLNLLVSIGLSAVSGLVGYWAHKASNPAVPVTPGVGPVPVGPPPVAVPQLPSILHQVAPQFAAKHPILDAFDGFAAKAVQAAAAQVVQNAFAQQAAQVQPAVPTPAAK